MQQRSMIVVLVLFALLMSACAPIQPVSQAQTVNEQMADVHSHDAPTAALPDELGEVNFSISCTPEAQAEFNLGMAYMHTFWFAPAIESFETVAELDPTCAMAYWGKAVSILGIPWSPASDKQLADGWVVVEQARALGGPTAREQAYIDAITAMYEDPATRDHRTRTLAYEAAMAQLAQDYPDDTEAQIFYALALNISALPTDKTYANQLKAAEILEPLFAAQPDHPGVAHYLIHSYDYPALADKGLDAAQRFAAIAPSSPHALHMPAHIFTRLGYWQESIATNQAAAEVAKANLTASHAPNTGFESALHAMDYMMYGYLQTAQDEAAQALMDEINAIQQVDAWNLGSAYALSAIPARYVLERGQWAEGAMLTLHPQDLAWDRFPQTEAIVVFARGLSAARAGDVAAARQDLERLQTLHETLVEKNDAYWTGMAAIQAEEITAWIALAEGQTENALAAMRHAAELEDATEKHPVSPGPIVPAHELLGEMLLELDQPEEALQEFEASQQIEPNRFRGLYGAAHAAELAGETEKAHAYYEDLVALGANATGNRPELAAAEEFLVQ